MPRTTAVDVEPQDDELIQVVTGSSAPKSVEDTPPDPSMDPSSRSWDAKKYFKAQEKVLVFVHRDPSDAARDPSGKLMIKKLFSINGYELQIPTGVSVWVPKDFADFIRETGMGYVYSEEETYDLT